MMPFECLAHYVKQCPTQTIVECGVSVGQSMEIILNNMPEGCHVYGFDSFEGLLDVDWTEGFETKTTGSFKANEEIVRQKFSGKPVTIIAGHIPESLVPISNIGILHIDVDYYKVYMHILEHFYDSVVDGGVIIADDTPSIQYTGSLKAMEEFFEGKEPIFTFDGSNAHESKKFVVRNRNVVA